MSVVGLTENLGVVFNVSLVNTDVGISGSNRGSVT